MGCLRTPSGGGNLPYIQGQSQTIKTPVDSNFEAPAPAQAACRIHGRRRGHLALVTSTLCFPCPRHPSVPLHPAVPHAWSWCGDPLPSVWGLICKVSGSGPVAPSVC